MMNFHRLIVVLCLITGVFLSGIGLMYATYVKPEKHLVPAGYVGWICLYYDEPSGGLRSNPANTVHYDRSGKAHTDDPYIPGLAYNDFFYVAANGDEKRLDESMIHGFGYSDIKEYGLHHEFVRSQRLVRAFIGSNAQWRNRYHLVKGN